MRVPTKSNDKLKAILDSVNRDVELNTIWEAANVMAVKRLKMSDHGPTHVAIVANLAIKILRNLLAAGIEPSVGSVGDSYDNALAETIIGLYKTELIYKEGPWKGIEQVEFATLEWVDWFNNRRLLGPIGNIPPVEYEASYYQQLEGQAMVA